MNFFIEISSHNKELVCHFLQEVLDYNSSVIEDEILLAHEKLPSFVLLDDSENQAREKGDTQLVIQFDDLECLEGAINRANFFRYRNTEVLSKELSVAKGAKSHFADFADLDGRLWRFEALFS